MNNNRMLQHQLIEFPDQQIGFKPIGTTVSQPQILEESVTRDDIGLISRKGRSKGYQYSASAWDETYLTLDVYLSLVDHGDFD